MIKAVPTSLDIGGLHLNILQITNSDELYDHLIAKGDDHEDVRDERIPYWADLWPSAIALGEHLVKSKLITPGSEVHEMGCGLGLPGIIAGVLGARVLFTDYLQEALDFAEKNWKLNCSGEAQFQKMDWRGPDQSLKADLLLASDVAYEKKSFEYLPDAFRKLVRPEGKIIVSEPNRLYAQQFFMSLAFQDFYVEKFIYSIIKNN